jgi:hypothetical protein
MSQWATTTAPWLMCTRSPITRVPKVAAPRSQGISRPRTASSRPIETFPRVSSLGILPVQYVHDVDWTRRSRNHAVQITDLT